MKAEIDKLIRDNAIPAEIGGRSVLCLNESSIGHLVIDLQKLLKKSNEPERDKAVEKLVDMVILEMNNVWGSDYKLKTEANRKYIRARLNDGHTMSEMLLVVSTLWRKWGNTDMAQYLRPVTVFAPSKFQGYLTQAKRIKENLHVMIPVVDTFGNRRRVTKEQFEAAEVGFFTKT